MAQQWMSIVEYARTFAISDMTVRRRIRTGKLDAELRDGKYFIPVLSDASGNPIRGHVSKGNLQQSHPKPQTTTVETIPVNPVSHFKASVPAQPKRAPKVAALPKTSQIPQAVIQQFEGVPELQVSANSLINFCEKSILRQIQLGVESKMHLEQKIQNLHTKNHALQAEASTLKQQVEDLQLLVQMLEKRITQQ